MSILLSFVGCALIIIMASIRAFLEETAITIYRNLLTVQVTTCFNQLKQVLRDGSGAGDPQQFYSMLELFFLVQVYQVLLKAVYSPKQSRLEGI